MPSQLVPIPAKRAEYHELTLPLHADGVRCTPDPVCRFRRDNRSTQDMGGSLHPSMRNGYPNGGGRRYKVCPPLSKLDIWGRFRLFTFDKCKSPEHIARGFCKGILAATYSPRANPSTIGAGGLNFRVRDGNGWDPSAIATRMLEARNRMSEVRRGGGPSDLRPRTSVIQFRTFKTVQWKNIRRMFGLQCKRCLRSKHRFVPYSDILECRLHLRNSCARDELNQALDLLVPVS